MASYQAKQSSTAYPLVFLMVQSADHLTPATGLTPTVTISKAGGSFATPSGAVTEIANGWYKVAGNATDTGTLGVVILHATSAGADPSDAMYEVVANDPQDAVHFGLSALPNAAAAASGGLPTVGTGAGQITLASGAVTAGTVSDKTGYSIASGTQTFNMTGSITGNLSGSVGSVTGAVGSVTGSVGSVTGSVGSVTGAVGSVTAPVTAGTVSDKTGYSLGASQTFSTTGAVGSVTGSVASVTGNVGGSVGSVTGAVGSVTGAVGSITGVTFPTGFGTLTIASNAVLATLLGSDSTVLHSGTAQAGATSSVTLASGASAVDNAYRGSLVHINSGTGGLQSPRVITAYVGSTKVATVDRPWTTTPDGTSVYAVRAAAAAALNTSLQPVAASVANPVTVGTNNDKGGYGIDPTERGYIATAVLTDTTDTLGVAILAIKAKTDLISFDGSNNVNSATSGDSPGVVKLLTTVAQVGGTGPYAFTAPALANAPQAGLATDGSGHVRLAADGLDLIATERDTGGTMLMNARQALSFTAAAAAGTLSGAGTGTIAIKGAGQGPSGTTRITATTDNNNNRLTIVLAMPAP